MADSQTSNIGLFIPARGNDTGTWDTPVNANSTLLDLIVGGTATVGLNNSNIVLSANQFQCEEIIFNSTLTGSVTITFPTSFTKSYVIQNTCTGSSQFTITLETASPGHVVGCPPGEIFEVRNDGVNIKFKNFGRIGSLLEHCGSSVPNWIPACTVPPYLNCDGTTFSSATYPYLTNYLGGTTLPDSRGRVRATLNQGTGRMNSSNTGVDGNTLTAAGGSEFIQQHSHPFTGTPQTWTINQPNIPTNASIVGLGGGGVNSVNTATVQSPTVTVTPSGTVNSSVMTILSSISGVTGQSTGSQNMQPTYIGGLTLILAGY